jgi:hypothetical protein
MHVPHALRKGFNLKLHDLLHAVMPCLDTDRIFDFGQLLTHQNGSKLHNRTKQVGSIESSRERQSRLRLSGGMEANDAAANPDVSKNKRKHKYHHKKNHGHSEKHKHHVGIEITKSGDQSSSQTNDPDVSMMFTLMHKSNSSLDASNSSFASSSTHSRSSSIGGPTANDANGNGPNMLLNIPAYSPTPDIDFTNDVPMSFDGDYEIPDLK